MEVGSLDWSRAVTTAVAPFLDQAVRREPSPFDRPSASRILERLFSYATDDVPLDETVDARWTDGDLALEQVAYATGPLTRASACVVKPASAAGPLPGLVLLHCHSGVYAWGKEKVCAPRDEPDALREFRHAKYEGRSLAHDLAGRGFVVVVPDAFYFGARAVGPGMPDTLRRDGEHLVAKSLFLAGHSWPALAAWEDRRALEFLWRRPDVDPSRLGCLGLSLGAFRAMMLGALDRRVGAVVSAGWLGTVADLLAGHVTRQSWTVLPWGLWPDLDIPDIAAAAHPAAFLALLCRRDHLFSLDAMQAAADALTRTYRAKGDGTGVAAEFFDVPHRMTLAMQERAAAWLEQFLAPRPLAGRR